MLNKAIIILAAIAAQLGIIAFLTNHVEIWQALVMTMVILNTLVWCSVWNMFKKTPYFKN